MASDSLSEEARTHALIAGAMRVRGSETETLVGLLGSAHTHGLEVDWQTLLAGFGAKQIELPTYAFQRQRYWLGDGGLMGDASSLGQVAAEHPLLGAMVHLANDTGWVFTGRMSLRDQRWLGDHAVMGTVLLPAMGFIELALAAGQRIGAEMLHELTFEAPLILGDEGAVQMQIVVAEHDDLQRYRVEIYSRPQSSSEMDDASWTCHASGALGPPPAALDGVDGHLDGSWPPEGAEVEPEWLYDRLAEIGYEYGPAFQRLQAAWQRDGEGFGEIALTSEQARESRGYGIHPALLDATLHLAALASDGGQLWVPFSVRGVRLRAGGASALRVHLTLAGENALSIRAVDSAGAEVVSIESLVARPIDARWLRAGHDAVRDSLFKLDWVTRKLAPGEAQAHRYAQLGDLGATDIGDHHMDLTALLRAIEGDAPAPDVVLARVMPKAQDGDLAERTRELVRSTLTLLQGWLSHESLRSAQLVLVTHRALAVGTEEAPDLASAAAAGLMRSAQSEHPGRFVHVDLDPDEDGATVDWAALLTAGEPQIAVRKGSIYGPSARARSRDWR